MRFTNNYICLLCQFISNLIGFHLEKWLLRRKCLITILNYLIQTENNMQSYGAKKYFFPNLIFCHCNSKSYNIGRKQASKQTCHHLFGFIFDSPKITFEVILCQWQLTELTFELTLLSWRRDVVKFIFLVIKWHKIFVLLKKLWLQQAVGINKSEKFIKPFSFNNLMKTLQIHLAKTTNCKPQWNASTVKIRRALNHSNVLEKLLRGKMHFPFISSRMKV